MLVLASLSAILFANSACALRQSSRKVSQARELTPADGSEYIKALTTINRFCPLRCASKIVQPANTAELAGWMRANIGTPFTVKGGGHSYTCQSVPKDGGVMIHTGRLKQMRVFKRPDGTAFLRTGTGLSFDEVVPRLAKMGYSIPHGECLTVGMGGWNFNVGQHPELKNFDNEWGYNGSAFLTKATFVDYDGTIFSVDKNGLNLIELGNSSRLAWEAKALKTKTTAAGLWLGTVLTNEIDIVAVSNIMRVFKAWGASLAIATEMEIELIPKPEPGFFEVRYAMGNLTRELNQAIFDVVANSGTDPKIDCGIFYASHYVQGTLESVISLKCADWASRDGVNVKRVSPPGYIFFGPKKSGFLFWSLDSYGKGWVPVWHAERLDKFKQVGGADKYYDYLMALESPENPCDSCSSELMFMLKPVRKAHVMFDNLCSARRANQNACSAYVSGIKEKFLDGRDKLYKQNLASCAANPKWKSEIAEYMKGANLLGEGLKRDWDRRGVVDFWMGLGHDNSVACDAMKTEEVGATCRANGITDEDLVQAELDYVRGKCPAFESYTDMDRQNNLCAEHIYSTAQPVPVTNL